MGLLHQTNIQELIDRNVKGKIVRVGGRMNQLLDYKGCQVTDINIFDGGYGLVRNNYSTISNLYKTSKRQLRQEIFWILYGEREIRDRKTLVLDLHFASSRKALFHKYDASLSSNVIEHSPNPIWLLLNFYFITKENGFQYHAIPNYRYTFDEFRKVTSLEHMVDDFRKKIWFDDQTHNEEYIQSAIERNGHQRNLHHKYPVAYPYMHMHVFDENNVRALAEYMFEEVTVDFLKTDKINDNLLIFKNKLNSQFLEKHGIQIEEYQSWIQKMV